MHHELFKVYRQSLTISNTTSAVRLVLSEGYAARLWHAHWQLDRPPSAKHRSSRYSYLRGLACKSRAALYEIYLESPLLIKDGLYMKCISGDTGLARFHRSLDVISKKRPYFLWDNLFVYRKDSSICCTMLGVEAINKDKHQVLSAGIGYLPDYATSRVFCNAVSCWSAPVGLRYMRAGCGQKYVPLCSSINRITASSDRCIFLDSLHDDLG